MKKKPSKNSSNGEGSKNKGLGQPYGDRVLVKPAAAEEKTSFGLIIPDTTKEKPEQGVVVAVGPGKKNDAGHVVPLSVKVGDRIMFSKYGYDEVKINGTDYYLIREDSITYIF
jgi:chaperonin GroES